MLVLNVSSALPLSDILSMIFDFALLCLTHRSTLEHYVRVRAKNRVPGGSLGRSFSRSCAGLATPSPEPASLEARRASLRVSLHIFRFLCG